MKKVLLIGIILFSLKSCSLEDSTSYFESFGVVKKFETGTLYIQDDDGVTLIPNTSIASFVEEGDRVWSSFTIESENANKDTLTIVSYRITKIVAKSLQDETDMPDVGIDLWNAWIAQGFLTFDFRIRTEDQSLIKNHEYAIERKEFREDTLQIRLKHDSKGDDWGILCRTSLALKLNDFRNVRDSVIIAIDYKDLNGAEKTIYRTYKSKKD